MAVSALIDLVKPKRPGFDNAKGDFELETISRNIESHKQTGKRRCEVRPPLAQKVTTDLCQIPPGRIASPQPEKTHVLTFRLV